jgi:hypothetical protein
MAQCYYRMGDEHKIAYDALCYYDYHLGYDRVT